MTTIAELLVEIGVEVEDAKAAEAKINSLEKETKELGETAKKTDKETKSFAKGLGTNLAKGAAVAAAAIAAAAAAIFSFVNDTTAGIDATNKLATALGLPVEELQRLQFAAERSGVEAEKLKAGVLKVNAALLGLQEGAAGPASQALEDLGLGLSDLEGLSTTNQIGLIGDRLQEIGNEAERSALSARIFGEEAGPAMASLLAEGQAGLEALGAQAKNVLTQEEADRASAFQDSLTNLSSVIDGIVQQIAVDLIPPIMEMIEGLQMWLTENEELVDQVQVFIGLGLEVVLTLLADLFNAVMSEVQILVAIFKPLISFVVSLIKRVDEATGILSFFRRVITALFSPLNTLIDIVETVILGLEKLGIVSEGTAARFGAAVDKMVSDSAGFNTIGQRADDAGGAVADLQEETESATDEFGNPISTGAPTTPEQQNRNIARAQRRAAREARRASGRAGGRGGAGKKPKKQTEKKPKKTKSSVTFLDVFNRLIAGDATALEEDIKGLDASTPDVRDVEPTVAITFVQVDMHPGAVVINGVVSENIGDEISRALVREFTNAGNAFNGQRAR